MEKVYTLDHLDCANCAAKIESKFNALPEVESAVIVFATRQLRLTAEDPDALIPRLEALGRTVEADFTIVPAHAVHNHDRHEPCSCGHEHPHESCACGHDHAHEHHHDHAPNTLPAILLGAALFALGLILSGWKLPVLSAVSFVAAYLTLGFPVLSRAGKNLLKGHL